MDDVLECVIKNAEKNQKKDPLDFIGKDGLLYCGKCKEKKQTVIQVPGAGQDGLKTVKVPVMCLCAQKAYEEDMARKKAMEDMQALDRMQSASLMDARFREATFDKFISNDENQKFLKLCKRYVDMFDTMAEMNQGLLFYGNPGTGKSFAAACIANALIVRRVPVIMTSFVKILEAAQNFAPDNMPLMNRAKLLIIDDLGAERSTDFALEKVYNVIDSRYRAKLPMILTTNLTLDAMKKATDIRYNRVYDRIFQCCYPVMLNGRSWRKAESGRRFEEMRRIMEEDT